MFDLPTKVEVGGVEYAIRTDFRVMLELSAALDDVALDDEGRAYVALILFYIEPNAIPPAHHQEAVEKCLWFLNCGQERRDDSREPKVIQWEKDFQHIAGPVNKVLGYECRSIPANEDGTGGLHWWSFMAAFREIGDCYFAQIVSIRDKKARGKTLDKSEKDFYRKNVSAIEIKQQYTEQERASLGPWLRSRREG